MIYWIGKAARSRLAARFYERDSAAPGPWWGLFILDAWSRNTYIEAVLRLGRQRRIYFRWRIGGLPGGWRVKLEYARREASS